MTTPDRSKIFGDEIEACKNDFEYFASKYLKIIDRNSQLVSFQMKPAQRTLLQELETNPWQMVLKARQMGSSTVISAYFFWKTLFTPNERTLVVAHTHDAVRNIYRIYKNFYDYLPKFLQFSTKTSSANEIVFFHGGTIRVASATSQNYRGATYNNLHCSETAFWKDIGQTVAGLFQTATGNSHIIIETTANGLNSFHSLWQDASNGFGKTFVSWTMEPDYYLDEMDVEPTSQLLEYGREWGLTDKQLWWAAQTLAVRCTGSWPIFLQEYAIDPLTCFVSSGDRFFDEVFPHVQFEEGYREYETPFRHHAYVLGADVASGSVNGDYSAFAILDVTGSTRKIVATFVGRESPLEFARRVYDECVKWDCTAVIESNSYGLSVLEYLRHQEWGKVYTQEKFDDVNKVWTSKLGFSTNSRTRPVLLSTIQQHINGHILKPTDERLRFQMNTFVYDDKGRPDHARGCHDDLVFAVALALQGIDQAIIETQMARKQPPSNLREVLDLERKTGKSVAELTDLGYFEGGKEEQLFTTVAYE